MNTATDLIKQVKDTDIQAWSDEKKRDFVKTFGVRAADSRFILEQTAQIIFDKAHRCKFISRSNFKKFGKHHTNGNYGNGYYGCLNTVEPRSSSRGHELMEIADDRAKDVLKNLPSLKKALSIISPEITKLIVKRDATIKKGQKLLDEFIKLSEPICMSDIDQDMTVGAFRKFVKQTETKRDNLQHKLNQLGKEGRELEIEIDKGLFSGVPGLNDSIINVINKMMERAKGLRQMERRVEEQVMFGDSKVALDILKSFEGDEVKLTDDTKAEFKAALDILLKPAKQLKGKTK